ncbi:hypothetical protein KUH06_004569 [Vibrio parahaemolyticus]|nr:hypothetical protein [Vibrio parahaemolyticus]EIV8488435.1 hypothetical protein [Vibrio parahaemolyticus]
MNTELAEKIVEALLIIDGRISAIELAQQLFAMHLGEVSADTSEGIVNTFNNISGTDKLDVSSEARKHLSDLALLIQGDTSVELKGLLKHEEECEPSNPIPWLKEVIDGGKKT